MACRGYLMCIAETHLCRDTRLLIRLSLSPRFASPLNPLSHGRGEVNRLCFTPLRSERGRGEAKNIRSQIVPLPTYSHTRM